MREQEKTERERGREGERGRERRKRGRLEGCMGEL